jgi:serralysin
VAWKLAGTDQYTVWNLDSTGHYVSSSFGVASGSNSVVQSFETVFQQDINGDSTTGLATTVIETAGSTDLAQVASSYFLYAAGSSSGPQVMFNGAPIMVGQYGGSWALVGGELVSGGYEAAWKLTGTDQYVIWSLDSGGNYLSSTGAVSGAAWALQSHESSLHQDLNGDGTTGPVTTIIETAGATDLARVADTYFLFAAGSASGPQLSFNGMPLTMDQFGSNWTLIGGERVGSGYVVAWKNSAADEYAVWNLDGGGHYVSSSFGVASGSNAALQALETSFQQDLNGDGTVGPAPVPASDGWHL